MGRGFPYIFPVVSIVSISHQSFIQCSVSALTATGSLKVFFSAPIFNKLSLRPVLEHNALHCMRFTGQQIVIEGTAFIELLFQDAPMSNYCLF